MPIDNPLELREELQLQRVHTTAAYYVRPYVNRLVDDLKQLHLDVRWAEPEAGSNVLIVKPSIHRDPYCQDPRLAKLWIGALSGKLLRAWYMHALHEEGTYVNGVHANIRKLPEFFA